MVGWRRAVEVLPAVVVCGVSFAGVQFYVSNYVGPELTDILSSLTCIAAMVLVLKLWKPKTIMRLEGDRPAGAVARTALGGRGVDGLAAVSAAGGVRARVGRPDDQARASTSSPTACCRRRCPKTRRR